jgi:hypothetical protein
MAVVIGVGDDVNIADHRRDCTTAPPTSRSSGPISKPPDTRFRWAAGLDGIVVRLRG